MKNKITKTDITVWGIYGIFFLWLISVYSKLPDVIRTHFNFQGVADGYGSKKTIIYLWAIALGADFIIKIARKIDPKSDNFEKFDKFFHFFRIFFALFMCIVNRVVVLYAKDIKINATKITMPLLGLLFIFMGNYMPKVKSNYSFGIRTPWTLASENVWYVTHRKRGKIWTVGGIVITALSLIAPRAQGMVFMFIITIVTAFWPIVISYTEFQKEKDSKTEETPQE